VNRRKRNYLFSSLLVAFVTYGIFVEYIWSAMHRSPEQFGQVMAKMPQYAYFLVPFEIMWTHARAGHLQTGDAAPDFKLLKLDESDSVQLSSLSSNQPVVLIFGSYT
jgi:hypothetical protein